MFEEEKFSINIEKLQDQVKKEVQAEEKYYRENDAKLRAIEQRVSTYEDFRQMVLASHLKPLDKGESLKDHDIDKIKKVWNSVANSNQFSVESDLIKDFETEQRLNLINTIPKNNLEFLKVWRRIEDLYKDDDNETKWCFLKNLKCERIFQIFQSEINGDLLGKFLNLFEKKLKRINLDLESEKHNEIFNFIIECLKIFSKCNRFNLNLMFLKTNDLNSCKNIFLFFDNLKIDLSDLKTLYLK